MDSRNSSEHSSSLISRNTLLCSFSNILAMSRLVIAKNFGSKILRSPLAFQKRKASFKTQIGTFKIRLKNDVLSHVNFNRAIFYYESYTTALKRLLIALQSIYIKLWAGALKDRGEFLLQITPHMRFSPQWSKLFHPPHI